MIKKITDIFQEKAETYSFEYFPPKTPKGVEKLYKTAEELNKLGPDFVSVTYGAGGSSRGTTMEICTEIQGRLDLTVMHHLTCVRHSQAELKNIIHDMKANNIKNILALRGDTPKGVERWEPAPDELKYCYQLIDIIREIDRDFFSIGVAGFPEGHINCPDKETDTKYLRMKIDHGGEFVVTQLFFDNAVYSEYMERLNSAGATVRVIPGILPITSYEGLIKFCDICGTTITQEVHDMFKPLGDDEDATTRAGIEFAVRQCLDLLDRGAPGLHFFTLNKVEPAREIWIRLGLS
jgi:methylenetetrahydrofolate reductase (NADPH)